jgi:hypothetical protein
MKWYVDNDLKLGDHVLLQSTVKELFCLENEVTKKQIEDIHYCDCD